MKQLNENKLLKILSLCTVIFSFAVLLLNWSQMPAQVPMHYNAAGEIDRFGSKWELLMVPIMEIVIYLLLQLSINHPNFWNIPFEVSEEKKPQVYACMALMLEKLRLICLCWFAYMTLCSIHGQNISIFSLMIFFPLLILILVIDMRRAYRKAKRR